MVMMVIFMIWVGQVLEIIIDDSHYDDDDDDDMIYRIRTGGGHVGSRGDHLHPAVWVSSLS